MSPWKASAIKSYINLKWTSLFSGMPNGTSTRRFLHRFARRNLDPPLDLANVLEIIVEPGPIARTDVFLEKRKLARHRIENAGVLLASGSRSSGLAPSPNKRSKAIRGLTSVGSGCVGVGHEMEFV